MSKSIAISKIKVDGGTQSRAGTNGPIVYEYAELMQEGVKFPPIVVYHDGEDYWLADGFHRIAAAKEAKRTAIEADVRQGTRRDAVLHSVGANADHGLRRTNDDKRRAVEMLLRDDEWSKWSDREIARRCAVSSAMVGNIREKLKATVNHLQSDERIGADGRTTNTANIGKKPVTEVITPEGKPATLTPSTGYQAPKPEVITGTAINSLHPLKAGDTVRTPDGIGKVVSLRWAEGKPDAPPTYTVRLKDGSRLQRYKHDELIFVPTPPPAMTPQERENQRNTAPIRYSAPEDGFTDDVPAVEVEPTPAPATLPRGMAFTMPINSRTVTETPTPAGRVAARFPKDELFRLKMYHDGYMNTADSADIEAVSKWLTALEWAAKVREAVN